jgi:hypothetical protein
VRPEVKIQQATMTMDDFPSGGSVTSISRVRKMFSNKTYGDFSICILPASYRFLGYNPNAFNLIKPKNHEYKIKNERKEEKN